MDAGKKLYCEFLQQMKTIFSLIVVINIPQTEMLNINTYTFCSVAPVKGGPAQIQEGLTVFKRYNRHESGLLSTNYLHL